MQMNPQNPAKARLLLERYIGSMSKDESAPEKTDKDLLAYARQKLADSGFPVVALMDAVPGVKVACVNYDDLGAGRMATDYLLDKGHRQIAFAGWHTEFQTVRDRIRGYEASHAARKLALRPDLCLQLPRSLSEVRDYLTRLLRLTPAPTAILAENEMVGLTCCNALMQLGRRVPQDMAVMVFGDELPEGTAPVPMTAVAWRQGELCERALELLLTQLNPSGAASHASAMSALAPQLILRESA